jgi:hypothetical protein
MTTATPVVSVSQRYRACAGQCRRIAASLHGPKTRARLLGVAADYDRMADQAAARELAEAEPPARVA